MRKTYNVKEVADKLGVGKATIYKSIKQGRPPFDRAIWVSPHRVVLPRYVIDNMLSSEHNSDKSCPRSW